MSPYTIAEEFPKCYILFTSILRFLSNRNNVIFVRISQIGWLADYTVFDPITSDRTSPIPIFLKIRIPILEIEIPICKNRNRPKSLVSKGLCRRAGPPCRKSLRGKGLRRFRIVLLALRLSLNLDPIETESQSQSLGKAELRSNLNRQIFKNTLVRLFSRKSHK